LKEHIDNYQINQKISKHITSSSFISLSEITDGQARTCLIGLEQINDGEELLIAACDNGIIYDQAKFEVLKENQDVIAFSFRNNVTVVEKPSQYGWIKTELDGNKIEFVSVKCHHLAALLRRKRVGKAGLPKFLHMQEQ
jgi:hypothetical protein